MQMPAWKDIAHFMYGDVHKDRGFGAPILFMKSPD